MRHGGTGKTKEGEMKTLVVTDNDGIWAVSDHETAHQMIQKGGSFISRLGSAFLCADAANACKIKNVWQQDWMRYAMFAVNAGVGERVEGN
jgi:hypothetical protein